VTVDNSTALPPPAVMRGYPGRGIAVLCDAAGGLWWIYFLTGRSPSSRARRFRHEGEALIMENTDPFTRDDPPRHYRSAVEVGSRLVVGNGDHVDVIADRLRDSGTDDVDDLPVGLLDGIEAEPDPPIDTPRIAAVLGARPDRPFHMVSVRSIDGVTVRDQHRIEPTAGHLVMLHTHGGDTRSVITDAVPHNSTWPGNAERLWTQLDLGLRVALAWGTAPSATPGGVLPA